MNIEGSINASLREYTLKRSGLMQAIFRLENQIGAIARRFGELVDQSVFEDYVSDWRRAIAALEAGKKETEKDMTRLAKTHPLYGFVNRSVECFHSVCVLQD